MKKEEGNKRQKDENRGEAERMREKRRQKDTNIMERMIVTQLDRKKHTESQVRETKR